MRSAVSSASSSDETNLTVRNIRKRLNHEFLLPCPDALLQCGDGVAPNTGTLH